MPRHHTTVDYRALCRAAADWPTIRELAAEYAVPESTVRAAVERRQVEALKTDLLRVNPASWDAFLARRHRPVMRRGT